MTLTSPQPALHPTPDLGRRVAPAVGPVLDHARFGAAPAVLAGDEVLTHADLARRVADRAATWGPARRLVLVEGANDLDSLVAYLAALQHGHVALVVPDGRARPARRDRRGLRPGHGLHAPAPATTYAAPRARTTCTPTSRSC